MQARFPLALAAVALAGAVSSSRFWLAGPGAPPLPPVVRVHVYAHSDASRDQEVKELARLAVLGYLRQVPGLAQARSPEAAEALLARHREPLEQVLRDLLARLGAPYGVQVQVGEFAFPARNYGEAVLPAGTYRALVVRLGDGLGRNWWCVAFPATCLTPAVAEELEQAPPAVREALARGAAPRVTVRWVLWDWLNRRWYAWRAGTASAR